MVDDKAVNMKRAMMNIIQTKTIIPTTIGSGEFPRRIGAGIRCHDFKFNRMKKTFLYIALFVLLVTEASAQLTSQYRYHIFDDYLLNPAYVGMQDYYPVNIGRDQRFLGLSNSTPQTYYLAINSRVGEGFVFEKDGKINKFFEKFGNIALGLQLFQYNYGPGSETNIGVTYGYHLDLNQNVKRKNQRKLVLALTPRLRRMGFNQFNFQTENDALDGTSYEGVFDPMLGDTQFIRSWMFSSDFGAMYKSIHGEFGVAALDFIQTRNRLDTKVLFYGDSLQSDPLGLYYTTKLMVNTKLTFIEMYASKLLDVKFVPSVAALYGPNINSYEFFVDLALQSIFKQTIAGVRGETYMIGELGLNISHTRIFEPTTNIQPYITLDFKNIMITYAQTINFDLDLVKVKGIYGGNQISVIFKISNDRTVYASPKASRVWY